MRGIDTKVYVKKLIENHTKMREERAGKPLTQRPSILRETERKALGIAEANTGRLFYSNQKFTMYRM